MTAVPRSWRCRGGAGEDLEIARLLTEAVEEQENDDGRAGDEYRSTHQIPDA